jgi:hypothetical protein
MDEGRQEIMDTHAKRLNYLNRCTLGQIRLVPNGNVELDDLKNILWVPFFFNYPEPEEVVFSMVANFFPQSGIPAMAGA